MPVPASTLSPMRQPGAVSRTILAVLWLLLGAAMIGVPVWLGWTRGTTILNGHPGAVVLGIVTGLLGFVAVAWSIASLVIGDRQDREGDPRQPTRRTPAQMERRARVRIALAVPALVLSLLAVVLLYYARPATAEPQAFAALHSENGVRVADRVTWYELIPSHEDKAGNPIKPTTGLIFLPGARIDPRAYAPELRRLADAGYLVVVLKEPFGFSIFDRNHAQTVIENHPEIAHWAIGGHSLGGTVAASFAEQDRRVEGLLLLASYPSQRVERGDLKVVSISGDADGLATPADIERSKANLPASTRYVVLPGAAHSTFADYGPQPGDGTPTADRTAVQTQVGGLAGQLLASLAPKQTK
jgi:hypothetical protein